MPYEAILFDFDGVLIDSEPIHFECWNQILAPYGTQLDWETYAANCIGVSDRDMIAALCRTSSKPLVFEEIWTQYPRKREIFRERTVGKDVIAADVKELLRELKPAYRLAVVPSSGQREVEPILEAAGLLPLLDTAVFGGDVVHLKPAPDPYLLAAKRLDVRTALVVEDSAAGMQAGRAAGFDVLHIPQASRLRELVQSHPEIQLRVE